MQIWVVATKSYAEKAAGHQFYLTKEDAARALGWLDEHIRPYFKIYRGELSLELNPVMGPKEAISPNEGDLRPTPNGFEILKDRKWRTTKYSDNVYEG